MSDSTKAIEGLKPQALWSYFAAISAIPRGSKNEKAVGQYVLDTARKLGLEAQRDRAGNVVVRKAAAAGRERARSVCLQGHLDMVCEKNAGNPHDFLKDPIALVRKGNVLMADGTTLGADNGVAVAANLALMEDKTVRHGPLEFLFTIDEETGLTGAANLAPEFVRSRTLLNLDSEEEGSLYVGCSGGRDSVGFFAAAFEKTPAGTAGFGLAAKGLRGGHSGLEIDKNRGNAIKILNRALLALEGCGARLASIDGGNKRNAIPRECHAVIAVPKKHAAKAQEIVAALRATIAAELGKGEPDFALALAPAKTPARVVPKAVQRRLTSVVAALPHGVVKMSSDIPGLVETSTNVAVITTTKKGIELATSQRSSVASEIDEICGTVGAIFTLGGAKVEQSYGYPGWKPDLDSAVLKVARSTYAKLYGKEPEVKAIHAGLECGIIGERVPGMDMVSFGPTLEGVHSPDEKIHIDTVGKFYEFLTAILEQVN